MAIKKKQITPRQKMINLMYVILMAMLALNISTEVLNGFSIVEESINRTTANSAEENSALYARFEQQMKTNPEKVSQWFAKAMAVKQMSDSLYAFSQQLKEQIVTEADGKGADLANIKNKDNLEAASHVMLAPITGKGGALFAAINHYRERILTMVTDERQRKIISSNLTTKLPRGAHAMGKLDGETGVGDYLDTGVIGIEALDGLATLLGTEPGLLALIDAHTDDDAVEEGQGARHHRVMADGEGVESACE